MTFEFFLNLVKREREELNKPDYYLTNKKYQTIVIVWGRISGSQTKG